MDDDQTAKRLEAVRASLDDAAKYVGNLYLTFLLASVYIAITVGSTNDEQLLRDSNLPLPLLGVGLPIKAFYVVTPIIFVLLHFHLLLHVYFLSRKGVDFESTLQGLNSQVEQEQRRLLFPLIISPVTPLAYPSLLIRTTLRIVTYSTVIVGPVLLLLFVQVRFLPFHELSITMWQRACLLVDLVALGLIWWRISRMTARAEGKWGRIAKDLRWFARGVTAVLVLIFSFCIASVPNEPGELKWSFFNRWRDGLHRNIELTDKTLVDEPPPVQLIAYYLQQGRSEEEAWRDHAKGIALRGRDLQGADLSYSRLYNADFRGSNLDNSIFIESTLEGVRFDEAHDGKGHASMRDAKLSYAKMRGAHLSEADLQRAELEGADLCGVNLGGAELQGAFLRNTKLNGANLSNAHLEASYGPGINLKGAHLSDAHLEVAALTSGDFRSADLRQADLKGAHLVEAKLQGADLEGANISGADMSRAELQLSNLHDVRSEKLTAANVVDLEKDLGIYFDDQRVQNALRRLGISEKDVDTRFSGANFKDSLYDRKLSETAKDLPPPQQAEEYLRKVVPFQVQLGCTDAWVAKSLIVRASAPFSRYEVLLATELLKARGGNTCAGLKQTSEEEWQGLQDSIDRANPLYREPFKSWP